MQPPKPIMEKVTTSDFVTGVIDSYQYEEKHIFKLPVTPENPTGEKVGPGVRFKFIIDGLQYPKHSRWLTFSYHEKATLYIKYISSLVKDARPKMDFDLDQLIGLKVKMLWKDDKNPEYQSLDSIRPVGDKIIPIDMGAKVTFKQSLSAEKPTEKLDVPF